MFARAFGHAGGASSEFQVNTYTFANEDAPAVACDATGNFVVVWQRDLGEVPVADIFGQRFEVLGVVPTPALSWAGLGLSAVCLLGAGSIALRRRKRFG